MGIPGFCISQPKKQCGPFNFAMLPVDISIDGGT
jgi:hypothetical protein